MPATRYIDDIDVQGWTPSLDGGVGTDLATLQIPSNFGSSSTKTVNMPSISRRQAPSMRARAAAFASSTNFTNASRPGPSAVQQARTPSYYQARDVPVQASARNATAAGRRGSRPRTSTERKIARKLAENANYVPRPKNSFILFRTEFVAQKTASGTRSAAETKRRRGAESDDDDDEANQSLSKQASAIWNRMTEAEKRPWAERAKLEKAAHEAKYPNYRYRPVRQGSTRNSTSSQIAPGQNSYPERSPSRQRMGSEISTLVDSETDSATEDKVGDEAIPVSLSSSTVDVTLQIPAPVRMLSLPTASPSSSALANALGSPTPTPVPSKQSQSSNSVPSLPSVPRIPTFVPSEAPTSSTTDFATMSRSPSVPFFDKRIFGQFPKQTQPQPFIMPPTGSFLSQERNSASAFAARSASCPSTPPMQQSVLPDVPNCAETAMHNTLSSSDESEADYFCNFGQFGDSLDMPPAGSASALSLAYQRMFMTDEKQNDDETNIETSMDIDMHALLNLSPIPEAAEIPASMSETTTAQKPFDAVAELWAQGQQVMDGATVLNAQAQTQTQIVPEQRTHMQTQVASPSSKSSSSGFSSENEAGLETYALAVGSNASGAFLYNYTCPSTSGSSCTDSLNEDLFHLDLDMDPVLGLGLRCSPAQQLPASALSFTALGGGSGSRASGPEVLSPTDADDIFAYDSERGSFGLNMSPRYGFGQGFELGVTSADSGFDYGFEFRGVFLSF